jgi:hypothetical protein
MPAEYIINEVIDVTGSITDLDTVLKEINRFEQVIQQVNKNPINVGGVSSLKELREAANQLTQSLNQLNSTVSGLSKTNAGKAFKESTKDIKDSTIAVQENTLAQKDNLTWSQFVSQRLGQYMKIYGSHAEAIKQISEEWAQYKATGESVIQTSQKIAAAQRNEIAGSSEKARVLAELNEKYGQASVLAKNLSDQFGAESEQAKNAARNAEQLRVEIEKLNAIQPAAATPNLSAYEQLKKETKEAEINARNLAAQFGVDSKEALEAAASYEVLRQKLEAVNNVTKQTKKTNSQPFDPNTVPYVQNASAIGEETSAANAATEAVNDLDRAEAQAANAATALGNKQLEANTELETTDKILPEITSELDQYTGSITANIQAQLENNAAIAANRAAQKDLNAVLKSGGTITDDQAARLAHLKAEEISLVDINRDLTATIKNQVKEQSTQVGSIDNLRSRVALLQRAYEGLSAQEKRSGTGLALEAQIDQLEPSLKAAEGEIGKYSRNVGNYASGFTKVFSTSFGYLKQLAYLVPGLGMAGIINLVSDAVVELTKDIFENSSTMEIANGQTKKMIEQQKELLSAINSTTDAFISYENAISKSNTAVVDKLKGELSVLEASGVNVERTFALKRRIMELEQQGAQGEFDINVRLASKERKDMIVDLNSQISLIEKRNTGFNKSAANDKRLEELKQQLNTLDVVVTKENAVDLSREYHRQNILKLDNQIIAANNKLGELIATGGGKKEIERQKEYIQNLTQREGLENKVYNELTSSQQKYVQTSTSLDQLDTEVAKFNADERRKYELESQRILVDEKKALSQSILSDSRSTEEDQLESIKVVTKEQEKLIEKEKQAVINNPSSSRVDRILAQTKAAEQLYALTIQSEDQKFQITEKYRLKDIEADKQSFVEKKKFFAEQLKELSTSTEFNVDDRLAFQKQLFATQKEIIDKEHQAKLDSVANTELTDKEKEAIETDYQSKILTLTRTNQTETTNILSSSLEKQEQLHEESIDKIKRLYEDENLGSSEQYSKDVIDLNNSLEAKLINYQQYQNRRRDLDNQYRIDSLRITIAQIQDELTAYTGAEDQFLEAQTRLNNLRASLTSAPDNDSKEKILKEVDVAQTSYNITKENVERKKALIRELNDAEKSLSDDSLKHDIENLQKRRDVAKEILGRVVDFVNEVKSLSDTLSDARIQQLELEKDALENRYQREQDLINQSYANQVDRDRALLQAKKANAAQKQILDEKEKQENIKKARFDKESAIFSIILNTAKAVVEDLGTPWKIAFDLAIGTAELAIAVAQPLPRYFKGKNVENRENIFTTTTKNIRATDNYEGPAIVDDGEHGKGKAELIVRENGSMEIGTDKPRVTWLHKNDIVYPDAKKAMEKRAEIEKLPVKSYVQYLPKFFVGKKADNPIGIAFPATSEKTIWNKELKSNIEKERHVEKENVYSFQKEIKDRVTEPIKLPDVYALAWQATADAANFPFVHVTTNTNTDGLSREDYMYGVNKLDRSIKNQSKGKRSDPNRELVRAWIRSYKSWNEFFKD